MTGKPSISISHRNAAGSPSHRKAAQWPRLGRAGWLGLGWLVICLWGGASAMAASFRAVLEPATVYQGQPATLALLFEGAQPDSLPALPLVPNLTFGGGGREERITIVNGRQSVTTTFRYTLLANQPGAYTVPAIIAHVGGQTLASQPVQLTVLPAAPPGQRTEAQPARALLQLMVPRTNVFVGEVLPVELNLYAINPRQFELAPLEAEGCTAGKSERIEPARVPMNGVLYTRTGMRTTVIPGKAGNLQLGPASGRVQVEVPVVRRRTGDPFEEFFNDPFFNRRSELMVLDVAAEPLTIQAQPVPTQEAPPTFTGAVGQFTLEVTAAPTNVAVGEPIRLRIQVRGKGALETLTLPSFDDWLDFRVYPAVSRVETTDTLGIEGTRIFEQDLVPGSVEVRQVPALVFSYFDPIGTRFVSLTNPPIRLIVRPTAQTRVLGGGTSAETVPKEIVHLKPRPGTLAILAPPLVARPWFLGVQVLPVLAWLVALALRRWREHLARNPRLVRRRQVRHLVTAGLEELSRHASAGDATRFFALVFRLLQEQLAERLDLPAGAITEAVLDERLKSKGVRAALLADLHGLFQACNQARYAPAGTVQNLRQTADTVGRVLRDLQGVEVA